MRRPVTFENVTLPEIAGVAAAALNLGVYLPYIRAVRARTARPQITTWAIWSALSVLSIASQWVLDARASLLLPAAQLAGCAAVCVAAWGARSSAPTRSDAVAVTIAIAGAAGWMLTDSPAVALVATIVAFGSGSMLTLIKTWRDPTSEPVWMWLIGATAAGCAALAVGDGDTILYLYPAYLAAANLAIAAAAARRPRPKVDAGPLVA